MASAFSLNRALWETHNLQNYSYVFEMRCYCLRVAPLRVVVVDGSVVEVIDAESGTSPGKDPLGRSFLSSEGGEFVKTPDDIFNIVAKALGEQSIIADGGSGPDPRIVGLEFDETYSFPVAGSLDYGRYLEESGEEISITDSRRGYRIYDLRVRP
jgi:hypothetical protein